MKRVGRDARNRGRKMDGTKIPAAVEGFLFNHMNRIRKNDGLKMNPVCKGFLINCGYAVRYSVFLVALFERIEDQTMIFFVDQHIVIGQENRMIL